MKQPFLPQDKRRCEVVGHQEGFLLLCPIDEKLEVGAAKYVEAFASGGEVCPRWFGAFVDAVGQQTVDKIVGGSSVQQSVPVAALGFYGYIRSALGWLV